MKAVIPTMMQLWCRSAGTVAIIMGGPATIESSTATEGIDTLRGEGTGGTMRIHEWHFSAEE
jgi:hypothetical protein